MRQLLARHRAALMTIAVAATFDVVGGIGYAYAERIGIWGGLYWAVTTATTTGYGDVTPKTGAGQAVAVVVMLTVVPLFAATFSLLASSLTAVHVHRAKAEIKRHVDARLGKDDRWPT